MRTILVSVVVLVLGSVSAATGCLPSLGCSCRLGKVTCRNVTEIQDLQLIMRGVQLLPNTSELVSFTLQKATLDWLPGDLFSRIRTKEFVLSQCTLQSLTKPDNDQNQHLFQGSAITALKLDKTKIFDADLSQIRDLEHLEHLVISGMSDTLFMPQLSRALRGAPVRELRVIGSSDVVWGSSGVRDFEHLNVLELSGLGLTEVSRKVHLPANAAALEVVSLKDNQLTSLPEDYLADMGHLQHLDLSYNRIAVLDETAFRPFNGQLALIENPLQCDASIEWFIKRLEAGDGVTLELHDKVKCADGTFLHELEDVKSDDSTTTVESNDNSQEDDFQAETN